MAKIYLSPAAHAHDNPTKCPCKCGENIHANQYMDIVERRLRECGFDVKRGEKALTGSAAMMTRTGEANAWGADLYYVAHTNAGGGRYSVTYCYPNVKSRKAADTFGSRRKALEAHNGSKWRSKTTSDLYEINTTGMICLYDELFFHDNEIDCRWFHTGGMELMAEEAVRGLCEVCGVKYSTAPVPMVSNKEVVPSVKMWQDAAIRDGFRFPRYGADGVWGAECEAVARKAIVQKRLIGYKYPNLTKIVQLVVGVAADGKCGKDTDKAIRAWQTAHGLTADGAVGINTWKKMMGV